MARTIKFMNNKNTHIKTNDLGKKLKKLIIITFFVEASIFFLWLIYFFDYLFLSIFHLSFFILIWIIPLISLFYNPNELYERRELIAIISTSWFYLTIYSCVVWFTLILIYQASYTSYVIWEANYSITLISLMCLPFIANSCEMFLSYDVESTENISKKKVWNRKIKYSTVEALPSVFLGIILINFWFFPIVFCILVGFFYLSKFLIDSIYEKREQGLLKEDQKKSTEPNETD